MRGTVLRKMEVARRIARLPKAEQEQVNALYVSYDRLEFLTTTPPFIMAMFGLLAPIYGMQMAAVLEIAPFLGAIGMTLTYAGLCASAWFLLVQPRRQKHKRAIRQIVDGSDGGQRAFDTLRRLDPDMARNCGNILT